MRMKRLLQISGFAIAMACAGLSVAKSVVVGGKGFTEQLIINEITRQALEAHDFDVDARTGMGSVVLRQAQENGQIDLYWEYTGTSLITYNKIEEPLNPQETYDTVKELDAEKGLVWLEPSKANNTYALAMRRTDAQEKEINSISDLADYINDGNTISFATNAEFAGRPDGLRPMQEIYGFEFGRPNIKRMTAGLTYQALKDEQVDLSLVFSTDGRIPAFDFYVLHDNKDFFPSYALTPVVRQDTLETYPELEEILNDLSALLDDEVMAQLNAQVDVEKKTAREVAQQFLAEHEREV